MTVSAADEMISGLKLVIFILISSNSCTMFWFLFLQIIAQHEIRMSEKKKKTEIVWNLFAADRRTEPCGLKNVNAFTAEKRKWTRR